MYAGLISFLHPADKRKMLLPLPGIQPPFLGRSALSLVTVSAEVFIHQWLYSPLLGPRLFFSFVIVFTQSVGLLGRVISPSQGRYPHRTTQTENKRTQTAIAFSGYQSVVIDILAQYRAIAAALECKCYIPQDFHVQTLIRGIQNRNEHTCMTSLNVISNDRSCLYYCNSEAVELHEASVRKLVDLQTCTATGVRK
jgi:hypothetical protein